MADYTLHDGRDVTIDAYCITHKEYRQLITPGSDGNDEPIIARACGLTAEEVEALPERDWRGLVLAVIKRITAPDPL